MRRDFLILALTITSSLVFSINSNSAEKLRFSTGVKEIPVYYLPVIAAEEQEFWKQNGLEVEWIPFKAGPDQFKAVAAGSLDMGSTVAVGGIQAEAAGVPAIMVAHLHGSDDFFFWVRPESPFRKPEDLKGTKIGVGGFGGTPHNYGRAVVKALGLEKEVKFISTGGVPQSLAMMKTGALDGIIRAVPDMVGLELKGEFRRLIRVDDYLPKPWLGYLVFSRKDLASKNPDIVRRAIKALLQATDFIGKNPGWAIQRMSSFSGYSRDGAEAVYKGLAFNANARIEPKAIENVTNFLLGYGIISKDKAPRIEELYSNKFAE